MTAEIVHSKAESYELLMAEQRAVEEAARRRRDDTLLEAFVGFIALTDLGLFIAVLVLIIKLLS